MRSSPQKEDQWAYNGTATSRYDVVVSTTPTGCGSPEKGDGYVSDNTAGTQIDRCLPAPRQVRAARRPRPRGAHRCM